VKNLSHQQKRSIIKRAESQPRLKKSPIKSAIGGGGLLHPDDSLRWSLALTASGWTLSSRPGEDYLGSLSGKNVGSGGSGGGKSLYGSGLWELPLSKKKVAFLEV